MGLWYILEYQYPTEMAVADLSCLSFRFFLLLQIRDGTHQHLVASNIFADLAQVLQKCAFVSAVKSRADGKSAICNEQFKIFGWETRQSGRMQNISQKGHLSGNSHQSWHVAVANYVFLLVNVQTEVK